VPEAELLQEANRAMTLCNACRYCEGLCGVFPAMEMRRSFVAGDLRYLANLCHGCGACYAVCPFAPPHEFDLNVPKTLASVRTRSYADYAWPRFLAPMILHNALALAIASPLAIGAFFLWLMLKVHTLALSLRPAPRGADFYAFISHQQMALLFGVSFLYSVVAIGMGGRKFWRDIAPFRADASMPQSLWQACKDAASLRYLDGGGDGCGGTEERVRDLRRLFHHLTAYGFLLCFAATATATMYHYVLRLEAPYAWWQLPVLLGVSGGIGLLVGSCGLLIEKFRRDPNLSDPRDRGMEIAFIILLALTAASGLLLTILRDSLAMPVLLAVHLGTVMTFFLALPYSKFVHGLYRFLALVRSARERATR
jgi:citrate/tricarballylate utilization protein